MGRPARTAPVVKAVEPEVVPEPFVAEQFEGVGTVDVSGVEMVSVETTGNFMIMDLTSGKYVEAEGATEVPLTDFIRSLLDPADGRLKLA